MEGNALGPQSSESSIHQDASKMILGAEARRLAFKALHFLGSVLVDAP